MDTLRTQSSPENEYSFLRLVYPAVVFFAALFAWNSTGESARTIDSSLPAITENAHNTLNHNTLSSEPATGELPGSPVACEIKGTRIALTPERAAACKPPREARANLDSSESKGRKGKRSRQ